LGDAGPELFAEALAFGEVAEQGFGEVGGGLAVGGPLELIVTLAHVLDQVFHPKERVTAVAHGAGFLREVPGEAIFLDQGDDGFRKWEVRLASRDASIESDPSFRKARAEGLRADADRFQKLGDAGT
jgi:hypothetical protein